MITLTINDKSHDLDVEPEMPLLWVLRDRLDLTGTKFGCGAAQCGACTVHIDGEARRSCSTMVGDVQGSEIVTIEGLPKDGPAGKVAQAVQAAWQKLDVVQCGYCQSGQIMSAINLLTENQKPTDDDINASMEGNICRCGTYVRIRHAIHEAAKSLA